MPKVPITELTRLRDCHLASWNKLQESLDAARAADAAVEKARRDYTTADQKLREVNNWWINDLEVDVETLREKGVELNV